LCFLLLVRKWTNAAHWRAAIELISQRYSLAHTRGIVGTNTVFQFPTKSLVATPHVQVQHIAMQAGLGNVPIRVGIGIEAESYIIAFPQGLNDAWRGRVLAMVESHMAETLGAPAFDFGTAIEPIQGNRGVNDVLLILSKRVRFVPIGMLDDSHKAFRVLAGQVNAKHIAFAQCGNVHLGQGRHGLTPSGKRKEGAPG
jgi:hypothetical protein